MFFYVSKRKQLQILEEIAQKERYLHCVTGCDVDPQWQTYFKLLYPDAARLYTEVNRKQIDLYKKHGDGITPARRVTFFLFFPAESLVPLFFRGGAPLGGSPSVKPNSVPSLRILTASGFNASAH